MSANHYTHILFDHDGVLVDTEPLYFQATQKHLAHLGIKLDLEEYLTLQARGATAWDRALANGYSQAEIDAQKIQRNDEYQRLLCTCPIEIPGVEAVLEQLAQRYALAIVTTARQSDFDLIHAKRQIAGYMDFVLTNKDYARSKPAPDPYLKALERFGINPEQALIVEDSQRGLGAAVAAGVDCAVVHHPFTASQDFSAATYHLDSLRDLLGLLQK